jgi:hypothetical protein
MRKQVKKSLQQFEDRKLEDGQLKSVKGGEDTTVTDDIIMG